MPLIFFTLSLILAAIFLVAGASKLLDQKQTEQTLREFGLRAALARPVASLLPFAELAAGAALLIPGLARWGAWAALLLLLLFIAVIVVSLARGVRPECHCFGQLSRAAIGPRTLLRNVVLAGVAALLISAGPETGLEAAGAFLARLSPLTWLAAGGVLAVLLVAGMQFWLLWQLWRQNGRLMLRVEALEAAQGAERAPIPAAAGPANGQRGPLAARAPAFDLPAVGGSRGSLDGLLAAGRPVLLVFADAGCGPCQALLPEVAGWQQRYRDRLTVAIVGSGWEKKKARQAAGLANVFVQEKNEVSERYGVSGTPSAVLIWPGGALAGQVATGPDGVRQLLHVGLSPDPRLQPAGANGHGAARAPRADVAAGQLVPPLRLRNLDGDEVNLADWLEQETALLFWSPSCGFCQRMLPELRRYERERLAGAPALLFISAGAAEANRALELASTVLLDEGFRIGRMFGAAGTPSAVRVDHEGRVASGVAVGGPAVLALLGIEEGQHERAI